MSHVTSRPLATLLAVVSAILRWGNWVFVAGIAVLVVAALVVFARR